MTASTMMKLSSIPPRRVLVGPPLPVMSPRLAFGWLPGLRRFVDEVDEPIRLALSLHAADDEKTAAAEVYRTRTAIWDAYYQLELSTESRELRRLARRALEIDPSSASAHVWFGDTFRGRGDLNGAIEEYRTAAGLDPLSPAVSDALAGGYLIAGRLDDAITQGKRTLELDPTYAYLDSTLANAYREKGLFDQAIALYQQGERFTRAPSRGLGITYARAGRRREAEQILARFLAQREKQYISAAAIGLIYAALGNKDEAFSWLERAYEDHDAVLTTIAFYPGSQPLWDDPRFIDLIKRLGFDPAKAIPRGHQSR